MGRRPKQERLPETHGGIPELEQLGYEYAALRDRRMTLLKEEVDLKKKTLEALHKNNLLNYSYEDLEIQIVPGAEKLRVKVKKAGDEDEENDE
jgi:hypothetical protein